jgi:plastocyanin
MPAWSIAINRDERQPLAAFAPAALTALPGDLISWANNDNRDSHWPAPIGSDGQPNRTGWLPEAIPPNASSIQSFSPPATGSLKYCCALHPDEKGVINVVSTPPPPAAEGE